MNTHHHTLPGPDDIVRRELANGIAVLVHEKHHSQSVVFTGSLNAGSVFDPPTSVGLASFLASVLLRGTVNRDFATIHELLEGNGASLHVSGGMHTVGFGGKSLHEDLPLLLDLLADVVRYPSLPEEHVERLRGQIITGLKIREQDTRYVAGRIFRRLAYPAEHPYSRPSEGCIETVSSMTRAQLADFHHRYFGPNGMILIVVGAIRAEDVFRLVEEKFGDWENSDQLPLPELPAVPALETPEIETVTMPGKSQSDVVLGVPGPSRFAEDWQAANLANSILGVFGMYGRIGAEVREKQGMAYYSYSRLDGGLGPGSWRVSAGVNPANVERVVDMIRDEIRRIITEPVSVDELADNKANFIGRLPLQLESNEGVAGSILTMERYGLGLDYLQRYADLINSVTQDDVLRAAQHYLNPDVYALAVAGPERSRAHAASGR